MFRKRCKTPPKHLKQHDLHEGLSRQIEMRQREANHIAQETKYAEKIEQLQLAEEYKLNIYKNKQKTFQP